MWAILLRSMVRLRLTLARIDKKKTNVRISVWLDNFDREGAQVVYLSEK